MCISMEKKSGTFRYNQLFFGKCQEIPKKHLVIFDIGIRHEVNRDVIFKVSNKRAPFLAL